MGISFNIVTTGGFLLDINLKIYHKQILSSVIKMIYIFFNEILNSNFQKIGIVEEKNEFRLTNLFQKINE